jgi:ribosome maturation protein SDO1
MVKLEDAVTARFDSHGEKFELLVDPDLALELRMGKSVSMSELLAVETVFKDAAKGTEQSPAALSKAFATTDVFEIAKKIVKDGEVQLTTEQRRKIREIKVKEVIDFIARNAMNPQTNAPHPPQRIENAIAEAKVKIDEMKSVEEQLPAILKELKKILPISMEQIQIAVKISAAHAARAEHVLHKYKIIKEGWQGDGSLIAVVEMPAGLRQDFLNDLNGLCHGDVETKILEK